MRKILLYLIVLLLAFVSNSISTNTSEHSSKAYTIETVPNVYVKDLRQHVSDPDGLLTFAVCDSINRLLTVLETKTGIQVMVVMLPSIGDDDVFEFSQNLFQYWGIGDKEKNNGLLITYVADQRIIRLHTGYGLEGVLTDALCKRIQTEHMLPYFRQGDIDKGMVNGVLSVINTLNGGEPLNLNQEDSKDYTLTEYITFIILFVTITIIIPIIIDGRRHRCKHCNLFAGLKLNSHRYYIDEQGILHREVLYTCSSCNHLEVKDTTGIKMICDILYYVCKYIYILIYFLIQIAGASSRRGGGSSGGGGSSSRW